MISADKYNQITSESAGAECIAISKKRSVEEIMHLYSFGHRSFGENYLQELSTKVFELKNLGIVWHYTGRIQSRKCQAIANLVDWVHSINSLRQLELLSLHRHAGKRPLQCLLQVIPSGYKHDYALSFEAACELPRQMPNLEVVGIMVMPAAFESDSDVAKIFASASEFAFENWRNPVISMGMSADYKLALQHGSNMLRLGRVFFSI